MNELEISKITRGYVNDDFFIDRITLRVEYENNDIIDYFKLYGNGDIKWFNPSSSNSEIELSGELVEKIKTHLINMM